MHSTTGLELDLLSIQASLGELEEHFRLLREGTEARLESLLAECDARAEEASEAQKKIEELMKQVSVKTAELATERKERAELELEAERK